MALDHQDNPFFPKIYNAKIYIYPLNHVGGHAHDGILYVEMERLHELNANKLRDNIEPILQSLGISSDLIKHNAELMTTSNDYGGDMYYVLFDFFKDKESMKKLLASSKNPKFKQALQIILKTNDENYISNLDLHGGNLMFRLTGVGPQLVFSDPFV